MSTSSTSDTHPKKDFDSITHRGLTALALLNKYIVELGPRLPPNTAQTLSDDLTGLGAAVPDAKQARDEAKAATEFQDVALAKGYAKVRSVRTAVRKGTRAKDVRAAYGVGRRTNKQLQRDVRAALEQIIDRTVAQPAEAASLGILPQDVNDMKTLLASVTSTGAKQDEKLASAPLTTRDRNLTANRILDTVGRIQGAGMIHFTDDATVRAHFEALGAGTKKTKKAKGAAPPAPSTSTTPAAPPAPTSTPVPAPSAAAPATPAAAPAPASTPTPSAKPPAV